MASNASISKQAAQSIEAIVSKCFIYDEKIGIFETKVDSIEVKIDRCMEILERLLTNNENPRTNVFSEVWKKKSCIS